jgi:hypothetical protein
VHGSKKSAFPPAYVQGEKRGKESVEELDELEELERTPARGESEAAVEEEVEVPSALFNFANAKVTNTLY